MMKLATRISLSLTLAITILLALVNVAPAQTLPASVEPVASARLQVQSLQQQADAIKAEIADLNHQQELLVESYNQTRVRLDQLTMDLADSHIRLDNMWARYEAERQQLSDRLVSIYKAGEVNVFEIIVNSEGFNDFYVQLGYLKKVNDQDYKLQEQFKYSAKEISNLTEEIDAKRAEQLSLERQQERQKEDVETLLAEREAKLGQVNDEVQKILEQEAARQLQEQLQARAEAEALLQELQISDQVQADVVLEALQYVGVPYVWGGESPEGFDCSGLTKYVYARFGVDLPHYAAYQFNMGVPVPDDQLQPADLLFFGPGNPYHVGMYIGQGRFIEATGNAVQINNLEIDSEYAGARRFPLQSRIPTAG